MKHCKWLSLLLAGAMLSVNLITLAGCNPDTPDTPDTSMDSGTEPGTTEAPEPVIPLPKLATLTLDDGYELTFDSETTSYEVTIPAGRPRVPRIAATAADEGAEVTLYQAVFPEGVTEAIAKVEVEWGGLLNSYIIHFKKDASRGFHLQYDDRYTFTPAYTLQDGEAFTFESSNADAVVVDVNGRIQVTAVSADPVTVTAKVNGEAKDTLTIDKTVRAPLNIFLVVGQSNADGAYSTSIPMQEVRESSTRAPEGTTYCMEGMGKAYDLSMGRKGFASPLAARWYELTGEKSLMIQTAVSGTPIERWEPDGDLYKATVRVYNRVVKLYTADTSKFEILRTAYFWCQGETGQMWTWKNGKWDQSGKDIMTGDVYYEKYMGMHEAFVKDMNVEIGSILLVRSIPQIASRQSLKSEYFTDLVAPRVAQYTIHNTTDSSLLISSRLGEIARSGKAPDKTAPGYNLMFGDNVHYNQDGYNLAGKEMAETTFASICATTDRTPQKIDVLASDGYARLQDGDTITVDRKNGYQLAAIVLPLYAKDTKLTFEVTENAEKCSVDMYGKITFADDAADGDKATVVIANESGLRVTLTAVLGDVSAEEALKSKAVTYRWDFNDLKEFNSYSDLSLSEKSPKDGYYFEDGCIVTTGNRTDFKMDQPFVLSSAQDWDIEWRGKTLDNSCLFGAEFDRNNFVYLAYKVPQFNNSFRLVDNAGTAGMISYGKYVRKVAEMNTWRVEYKADTKTMTLFYLDTETNEFVTVGSHKWTKDYVLYITNLFGRYGSDSVFFCHKGTMDYIVVNAIIEE